VELTMAELLAALTSRATISTRVAPYSPSSIAWQYFDETSHNLAAITSSR
jgi:hypothetical protein